MTKGNEPRPTVGQFFFGERDVGKSIDDLFGIGDKIGVLAKENPLAALYVVENLPDGSHNGALYGAVAAGLHSVTDKYPGAEKVLDMIKDYCMRQMKDGYGRDTGHAHPHYCENRPQQH